jgi:uncharacterized protein YktB (UPF0637 family)
LKRQIREERTINKLLSDDVELCKKTLKYTQIEEKDLEIRMFKKEAKRLRKLLEREIRKG